jgi:hypothetical protein
MGKYRQHQNRLTEIKLHLQKRFPGIRIFDRHVGMFKTINGELIRINKPGMADLYALFPSEFGLIHIEIEVKTGSARQSKDQKNWEKFIKGMGGIYIVARDAEETEKELERLIQGVPS